MNEILDANSWLLATVIVVVGLVLLALLRTLKVSTQSTYLMRELRDIRNTNKELRQLLQSVTAELERSRSFTDYFKGQRRGAESREYQKIQAALTRINRELMQSRNPDARTPGDLQISLPLEPQIQNMPEVYRQVSSEFSHSLNTPWASVVSAVKIINDRLDEMLAKNNNPDLEVLTSSASNALESLDDVQMILENGAGFIPKEPEIFSLRTLIRKVVRIVNEASEKAVDVKISVDGEDEVNFVRLNLYLTLLPLLENAFEVVPVEGNVIIHAIVAKKSVRITVQNPGVAIQDEKQALIFNPGYTTKPNHKGLGLSNAKKYIESAGGNIKLLSSKDGMTTFLVRFKQAERQQS